MSISEGSKTRSADTAMGLAGFAAGWAGVAVETEGADELAGGEVEAHQLVDHEDKVVALGNFGDALLTFQTCGQQFTRHDVLACGRDACTGRLISWMMQAGKRSRAGNGASPYNGQGAAREPQGLRGC